MFGSFQPHRRATRVHTRRMLSIAAVGLVVAVTAGCTGAIYAPATGVTNVGATLHGLVLDSADGTVTYWFDYGPTVAYGSQTPHRSIVINDRNQHPVSESVNGLTAGTIYHHRVCSQVTIAAYTSNPVCSNDTTLTTSGFAPTLAITAAPTLYPAFDPAVSDYVTRCSDKPVTVTVAAPLATKVAINGAPGRDGPFTQNVALTTGKSFAFSTTVGALTTTFHVRCLPDDFPKWTYSRPGTPSAHFYITTPQGVLDAAGGTAGRYVAIFDNRGTPVWWQAAAGAMDAKLLPNGQLGWAKLTAAPVFETHALDGTLTHTWNTVGMPSDFHEFQLLPNGNALIGSYPPRAGTVDLSPYGGPSTNATPIDGEIQEVKPDGTLVWSWNTKDHIDLSATAPSWRGYVYGLANPVSGGRFGFDWAHLNSFQETGNTIVVSFRHLNAVYGINRTDGSIIWKLGGTTTPESLTVVGDPESSPLGGQHYAHVLADGTLTLHDNNTNEAAPPRAVRYRLDLAAKTATLVESVADPDVTASPCCGSAAKLGDGSWLMSWGGTPVISEFGPGGGRHFELRFDPIPGNFGFSYRVDAVVGASPTIADLRAGMDAKA